MENTWLPPGRCIIPSSTGLRGIGTQESQNIKQEATQANTRCCTGTEKTGFVYRFAAV